MTTFDHTTGRSRFATRPNAVARLVQVASNLLQGAQKPPRILSPWRNVGRRTCRYRPDTRRPSCRHRRAVRRRSDGDLGVIARRRAERSEAVARTRLLSGETRSRRRSRLHTGSHRSPADCPVPTDRAFLLAHAVSTVVRSLQSRPECNVAGHGGRTEGIGLTLADLSMPLVNWSKIDSTPFW